MVDNTIPNTRNRTTSNGAGLGPGRASVRPQTIQAEVEQSSVGYGSFSNGNHEEITSRKVAVGLGATASSPVRRRRGPGRVQLGEFGGSDGEIVRSRST